MNVSELVNVVKIKRSELVGDAKNIIQYFFEMPERDPADQSPNAAASESEGVDGWQSYGFSSRLPAGAESVLLRFGLSLFTVASRMLGAAGAAGKLQEGDVAMYSIKGNCIRVNASGSVSIRVPTESGKDLCVTMNPKGNGFIKFVNGSGQCGEVSEENGIVLNAGDKDVTIAGKHVQLNAEGIVLNSFNVKGWAGAVSPLKIGPPLPYVAPGFNV